MRIKLKDYIKQNRYRFTVIVLLIAILIVILITLTGIKSTLDDIYYQQIHPSRIRSR
jgi:succinate dehydrogenase hydrophobic anchor subunit